MTQIMKCSECGGECNTFTEGTSKGFVCYRCQIFISNELIEDKSLTQILHKKTLTPDPLPWSCHSPWERNIGRVLLHLEKLGVIKNVERILVGNTSPYMEVKNRHGNTNRTYLDFSFVWTDSNKFQWVEVKGYMDTGSRTRINKIHQQYPDIWKDILFIVGYDSQAEGILGKRTKKDTAHSWLYSRHRVRKFWFYQKLKKQFEGYVTWE